MKKHSTKFTEKQLKKIAEDEQLRLSLLNRSEELIVNKFSDQSLDRANEKFSLLSGVQTSWKELLEAHAKYTDFIASKKREHEKTFPDKLYMEWRRLNGWDKSPYAKHHKPPIFGTYTKLFVYGRLPKEILPVLEELNDYIYPGSGIRHFKHFELVSDKTYEDIKVFISEIIKVTENCNDMYEFRVKYAAKYGVPFQLSLHRDNDTILNSI